MKRFTLESAKENFEEMMEQAQEGLFVIVVGTDGCEYSLKLEKLGGKLPRKAGALEGKIFMAEDFDAPLELKPYIE